MATPDTLKQLESQELIPNNVTFNETLKVLDEDPELEAAKKIIEEGGDTNKITKLTPDLVDELLLKGDFGRHLELNGLTKIDEGVAEKLAGFGGESLGLSGLIGIDEVVAEKFAAFQGSEIDLWGLEEIDDDTAKALAPIKSKLGVNDNIMEKIEEVEKNLEIPERLEITFQEGDTLGKIIREQILKYYPRSEDEKGNQILINEISKSIMESNGIEDDTKIAAGTKIFVSPRYNVEQAYLHYLVTKAIEENSDNKN